MLGSEFPSKTDLLCLLSRHKDRNKREELLVKATSSLNFVKALSTTVGKEILTDAGNRAGELFEKIAALNATTEETIEYKVLVDLLMKWRDRIECFYSIKDQIIEEQKNV